jgi:tRNA(Ile2) C34 agmatinyltransferase TiaS
MADPDSCPNYDEESDRHYHTPSAVAPGEEVESLSEYTDRVEAELNGMGIKVVRGEVEDIEEEVKEMECPKCGSIDCSYDGLFIRCNSCKYIEWAKETDGKLENLYEKWKRNIEEDAPDWF